MSILNKVVDAVTSEPSDDSRRSARAKALASAANDDWLSLALEQHVQLEAAFAEVLASHDTARRQQAQKVLAVLLTGHANAEESVLYPALAQAGEKSHAAHAYSEQADAKIQMAMLEALPPLSLDFEDQLEDIRRAVSRHMYEEESRWFLEIKQKVPTALQEKLTQRFQEEFDRYVQNEAGWQPPRLRRRAAMVPSAQSR
jgi:hypothetical protein